MRDDDAVYVLGGAALGYAIAKAIQAEERAALGQQDLVIARPPRPPSPPSAPAAGAGEPDPSALLPSGLRNTEQGAVLAALCRTARAYADAQRAGDQAAMTYAAANFAGSFNAHAGPYGADATWANLREICRGAESSGALDDLRRRQPPWYPPPPLPRRPPVLPPVPTGLPPCPPGTTRRSTPPFDCVADVPSLYRYGPPVTTVPIRRPTGLGPQPVPTPSTVPGAVPTGTRIPLAPAPQPVATPSAFAPQPVPSPQAAAPEREAVATGDWRTRGCPPGRVRMHPGGACVLPGALQAGLTMAPTAVPAGGGAAGVPAATPGTPTSVSAAPAVASVGARLLRSSPALAISRRMRSGGW